MANKKTSAANDDYTTNTFEDVDDSSDSLITPTKTHYDTTSQRKFKDKFGYYPQPNEIDYLNYLVQLEEEDTDEEEDTVIATVASVSSVAKRSEAAASTNTSESGNKKQQQQVMTLNYDKAMVTTVNKTTIIDGVTFVKCGTPPNIFLLPADHDIFDVDSTVADSV